MLNFNVEPYRDDFDPNKHFHRILFKPERAVQARELTQSQTILQDQISKFAFHIFSQNTPVTGGNVTINKDCHYIRLLSEYDGSPIDVNNFLNRVIRDDSGTVLAKVLAVAEEVFAEETSVELPTLVVSYISGQRFDASDVIYSADDSNFTAQLTSENHSGNSSVSHIEDGVFFVVNGYSYSNVQNPDGTYSKYSIGNFVNVQSQTIILDKYDNKPTIRIGLDINETIHDYIDDVSLLDPAIGASNYQAPGADRYVIELNLETRPLTIGEDQSFIELVRMENGEIKKQVDSTVYSVIDDYFAKRTSETNGNYIVSDFAVTPKRNPNDEDSYILTVGKGVGYVDGYRTENQSDIGIVSQRARTTNSSNNATVYFEYGNYFYVDNLSGFFDVNALPQIDIHCVPKGNINHSQYARTLIGTARARNVEYYSGDINTPTDVVYKLFVADISTKLFAGTARANSGTNDTLSLQTDTYVTTYTDAYVGATITIKSGSSAGDVRTITGSTTGGVITVDPPFTQMVTTSSTYIINFATKDSESFVLTANPTNVGTDINAQYGKERGFETGYTKLIESTDAEMVWNLGHSYVKSLTDTSYKGTYSYTGQQLTFSDNKLQITVSAPNSCSFLGSGELTTDQMKANFIVVNTLDHSLIHFDGINRKITVEPTNKQTALIEISDLGSSSFQININAKIAINNADASNILRGKELYQGNTTQYITGTSVTNKTNVKFNPDLGQVYIPNSELVAVTKQQSLYVCDVKRIVKIYETVNASTPPSADLSGMRDVTKYYSFDNGQKDAYYDHSYIKFNFGAPQRKGNLLVIFDYYEHSGDIGYFSVESYTKGVKPEQYSELITASYTAKNGDIYKVSDSIDFRPTRKNGDANFVFDKDYIVPDYLSTFIGDYEYYLGRKDILVLTKDKKFEILEGVPAIIPSFPPLPDDSMDIAKITLDPYTAFITGENSKITNISVSKVSHKTWKMKNISDLEKRVNNIEYFTSLSLLEKNADALQIQDENGLNRFKYGILADDFTGFSVADTSNFDFNSSILKLEKILTAAHSVFNAKLQCNLTMNTMRNLDRNYQTEVSISGNRMNNFISLPFTKSSVIEQKLASRTINVNPVAVIDVVGSLSLSPPMDTFVDNLKVPSLLIADPDFKFYEPSDQANLISHSDWKLIPGTEKTVSVGDPRRETDTAGGVTVYQDKLTTWTEQRQNLYGYYSELSNFVETNDFITDVNIMPYIRSQEIEFSTKGLLINTPLNCYFDGINVNEHIRLPNLISVTIDTSNAALGKIFKIGDIIGYISLGNFVPTGKVIGTVLPPSVRTNTDILYPTVQYLYVVSDIGTASYSNSSVLVSAKLDGDGNYISSSATGNIQKTLHASGAVKNSSGGSEVLYDLYDDETGRDYSMIKKASSLGEDNNVYIPKTLYKNTVRRRIGATQITLCPLASPTNNFYKDAIITVFNQNPIFGKWSETSVITSYDGTTKVATLSDPIDIEVSPATMYSIARNTSIYKTSKSTPLGTTKNNPISFTEPMPMMSSINGMFCGIFKVPGATFYSGSKLFRIDNGIDGNANSATTYAESTFFAASLATQSQSLQFASSIPGFTKTEKEERKNEWTDETYIEPPPPPPPRRDPLAQSFLIEGNLYPDGMFLKSISVFFRSRSIDSAISLYIVETLNGYPTTKMLENSMVTIDPVMINPSERPHYLDKNTKTTFEFDVPVYIKPDVLYAFVLKSPSPDYTCWVAAQNDFALPSTSKNLPTDPDPTATAKLSANPYVGTVFVSQNAMTWTADQTKSLMFTVEACKFDVSTTRSVDFVSPKKVMSYINCDFTIPYYNNDTSILANTTNTIAIGITQLEYDLFNVSTSDFIPTDTKIKYSYDTTLKNTFAQTGIKSNINPGRYGTPSKDEYLTDGNGVRILAANLDSSFVLTADLSSTNQWVSPIISDDGVSLYTSKHLINDLGVYNYNINIIDGGKNYSNSDTGIEIVSTSGYGQGASASILIDPDANNKINEIVFDTHGNGYAVRPKIVLSTVSTANTFAANNIMKFNVVEGSIANGTIWYGQTISNGNSQFVTTVVSANNANGWVTVSDSGIFGDSTEQEYYITGEPLFDDGSPAIVINCETCPNNGNGLSKYISKKVVLSPGDEAGDLRVYYTAYRPLGTNIYVYYKILSSEDIQQFDDVAWQIMTPISSTNKVSTNRTDLIEFVTAPGVNGIANNNVTYSNSNGETFTSFNQFAIKVVMTTSDPTFIPHLTDIRAIALPPGTGMS